MATNDSNTNYPYDKPARRISQTPVRHIKVAESIYINRTKHNPEGYGRSIPLIQIKGYWLQQTGFEIGTPITVEVTDGRLVLTAG